VSADRLLRDAERAADRLRLVGPRMAARSGPDAAAVLTAVRAAIQRLADAGADAESRPRRAVPELAPHALGDQVLVLVHDLAAAGGGQEGLDAGSAALADLRSRI
jgi:predicted TIM-barrel fold metal-dependent hydrolase